MKNKISLLLCMALVQVAFVFGQEKTVTGQATAADNEMSLPGVNVLVKETNRGTMTDMDGNYSINADENTVLVFSSVGFKSKEVQVGNQSVINVFLEEDLESLDEVVVTAFGIEQEKKSLGYAVQEIDSE